MIFQNKVNDMYKARVFRRCDDSGLVNYFSHKDFCGLSALPYSFRSSHGHMLQGYFYHYDGYDSGRLVIFDHGFGGGHRSYMKEIEMLCHSGYLVFAYDHTGCMESGGECTGGLSQSLCDLDDCISALKADNDINTDDISVVGHSWGGYAAMNIASFHRDIRRVVIISGFVSVKKMAEQNFSGLLSAYRRGIMRLECESNPRHADSDGIEALENSNARALLIYSANDKMVKRKIHYDALASALSDNVRVELWLLEGKGHNPNYTDEALLMLSSLSAKMKKLPRTMSEAEKDVFKNSFDWHKMTEQDGSVWERILEFLGT